MMAQARPVEVLLVEDNPGDIMLIKKVLGKSRFENHISVATDGQVALRRLRRQKGFEESAIPDFIVLDLNLPIKDGRSVLREIKSDELLKHIPVLVLTSSAAQTDILESYRDHANAYVCKPMSVAEFADIGRAIESFWFEVSRLPTVRQERGGDRDGGVRS